MIAGPVARNVKRCGCLRRPGRGAVRADSGGTGTFRCCRDEVVGAPECFRAGQRWCIGPNRMFCLWGMFVGWLLGRLGAFSVGAVARRQIAAVS